jgi:hypothetical protein
MIHRKSFHYVPELLLAGTAVTLALSNGGCSAANTAAGAAQGCDEFPASVGNLSIDGTTKEFVQATADFANVVTSM